MRASVPSCWTPSAIPRGPNGGISSDFWFGIEPQLGRDVFSFLLYGIRTLAGHRRGGHLLTVVIGVVIGIAAGYVGGKTDYVVGRIIDILLSFPSTAVLHRLLPVCHALFVAPDEEVPTWLRAIALILVLAAFGWASIARLLRGQVLGLREREFVEAAKVTGASPRTDRLQGTAAQPVDSDPHPVHADASARTSRPRRASPSSGSE